MRQFLIIILLGLCFIANGQSKRYRAFIDSFEVSVNKYFQDYTATEFLNSDLADKELDLLNVDDDLLNAVVFFTINKYRKKKRRKEFKYSKELDKCAKGYVSYYRFSSFRQTAGNKKKSKKAAKYGADKFGFKGAYIRVLYSQKAMLDKEKLKHFYHDVKASREDGDDVGMYYGNRPSRGDTTEQTPIEPYTYRSFADDLVSQWFKGANSRLSKSKALTYASCYVLLDSRTMFKSKMPSAKAILIFGGFRTELLPNPPVLTESTTINK